MHRHISHRFLVTLLAAALLLATTQASPPRRTIVLLQFPRSWRWWEPGVDDDVVQYATRRITEEAVKSQDIGWDILSETVREEKVNSIRRGVTLAMLLGRRLLGLVGKQMGERVVPVGFTDSQQLLLGTYEKITVEELIEYSSNHPVGLLEMAKKEEGEDKENQEEEGETAVKKFTADDANFFQRRRNVLKDFRRAAFLLGGISMALLAVRCIVQPLLEATVEGEPLLLFGEIPPELSEPLRIKTLKDEDLFVADVPVGFRNDWNGGGKREDSNHMNGKRNGKKWDVK